MFKKITLFRLTSGNAFALSGKISVQNMPNELRIFPSNGRKKMHSKFGSKRLNFFYFRSIQRPKILEKEWQETVLRPDCIMEKIRGGNIGVSFRIAVCIKDVTRAQSWARARAFQKRARSAR